MTARHEALQIAVVVTCYNQRSMIGRALESVLEQTDQQSIVELVLVDDGSTDGSPEVLSELALRDPKIQLVLKQNGGAASARNAGLAATTAPWVAFLDGDDAWCPEKLDAFCSALEKFPQAGLICSDYFDCDAELEPKERVHVTPFDGSAASSLARLFIDGGPILPSAVIVSRKALLRCGTFDESFRYNEDPELWLRIAAEFPLHHIDLALTLKRDVPGSLGSHVNAMRNWEGQRRITQLGLERYPALQSVRRKRLARDYARLAYINAQAGRRIPCAWAMARSIYHRPFNPRIWSYLLALVDIRLYQRAKKSLRSVR